MPIANCFVSKNCASRADGLDNLVIRWSRESNIASEHMTVNVMERVEQVGSAYEIMATLWLPSLWSRSSVDLLQAGLAKALADSFATSVSEVHVITHIVESGLVVENGKSVTW